MTDIIEIMTPKFFQAVRNQLTSRVLLYLGQPVTNAVADEFIEIHRDRIKRLAEVHADINRGDILDWDDDIAETFYEDDTPNDTLNDAILIARGEHSDEWESIGEEYGDSADCIIPQAISLITREANRIIRNWLTNEEDEEEGWPVSLAVADAFLRTHQELIRGIVEQIVTTSTSEAGLSVLNDIMKWDDSVILAKFSSKLVRLIMIERNEVAISAGKN